MSLKHPIYRHFENLGKATEEMGDCQKLLGGLDNLGNLASVYENSHHLLQLVETNSVLTTVYHENYSSAEAQAYTKGAISILEFLKECHAEREKILQEQNNKLK